MTIATYSDLVTEMGAWLDRADLDARIPTFVRLFEARMNRLLRDPGMEQVSTQTTVAGTDTYALPTGFRGARLVYIDASPRVNLTPMDPQSFRAEFSGQETSTTSAYAIIDGSIVLAPAPADASTLTLVHYKELTGLGAGNATNWLLNDHPDAYLFGSLCMAEAYLKDDERVVMWKGAWDQAVEEIRMDGNRRRLPGGPLVSRAAVRE
jgi:hypothetical protein